MKVSLPISMGLFAIGSALLALSNIIFIGPNNEFNCQIRPIMFNLSITLMISSLFWKTYRLWRVVDNNKLKKYKFTDFELILQILSFVLADGILHILRISLSAPFSEIKKELTNGYNIDSYICSTYGEKWLTGSALLKIAILLIAMILTIKINSVMKNDKIGDVKPLLFSVYNFSIFSLIYTLLSDIIAAQLLISFAGFVSVLFITLPKYLIILKRGDITKEECVDTNYQPTGVSIVNRSSINTSNALNAPNVRISIRQTDDGSIKTTT